MEFFSVDRNGSCTVGADLILQPALYVSDHFHAQNLETSSEIVSILRSKYPDGLTAHGRRYLMDAFQIGQGVVGINPIIDLIFELVRMSSFPEKPSRYQSFFGSESLEMARKFRQQYGQPHNRIMKVECRDFFKADFRLLNTGASAASALNLATKYWGGQGSKDPLWEVLMVPPVRVLAQIEPAA